MSTGKRLRLAIDSMGLNITEAAERSGIAYRTLQNYLLEEREPNAKALGLMCARLGISIDWLLTGEGPMRRDEVPPPQAAAEAPAATGISHREQAMLELFRSLDEDGQREIQGAAAEKKRLSDLEQRLAELAATVAAMERSA